MNLPKTYEPNQYESDIYALWEQSGAFMPKHRGNKGTFSIVLPPPNANGNLHVGHSLMFALQDIVIRYQRMQGKATLWVPGADHAGFETQVVYEKKLAKKGKSRFDFSREELYTQIWDFVSENRENYQKQFRRLGASVNWNSHTYTLDEKIVARAYATFKKMWDDGLVYRGERLVSFCTFHGTGFADIEVEYKEEKGRLWYIDYPLTDGSGSITVATTRPETMLGDTAVAVNPDDERYALFHGKTVTLPLTNREIPIITDNFVDIKFGTGAVKITPAHDINDYEAGKRHDLPFITVIDHEGKMTHDVPEAYRGLSVDAARKNIVRDLKEQGILNKEEEHVHNVGHCYKCGTIIQPLLREQWFVDMAPLAKPAIKALKTKQITFYPDSKRDQLITYLEGLRDWNISRQIAWGIPIPAFQNLDNPDDWIYDERVTEEVITVGGKTYRRDPDVFDTWFSSSSWPYATLDYPGGDAFKHFYPNSLMETGGEILYPWVSRMVMLGLYVTGDIPFKDVYIHGYVMAEDGAKMSKSIGNVIDPMEAIDTYGSDALRFGLITGRVAAVNRGYDPRKVEDGRNFCNKLWNVARFIQEKLEGDLSASDNPTPVTAADYWMMFRLQQSITQVSQLLDEYRFAEASSLLYHLVWDDFADWYIEASKSKLSPSVLGYSLVTILKLLHPFLPFVTETIWQTIQNSDDNLLITASWPRAAKSSKKQAAEFEAIRDIVSEIRFIKSVLHIKFGVAMYYSDESTLRENASIIQALAKLESVKHVKDGHGLHLTSTSLNCWLDLDQESMNAFVAQLKAKRDDQEQIVNQLNARLSNTSYVANAPKKIVEETRQQLAEAEAALQKMTVEYERFATQD